MKNYLSPSHFFFDVHFYWFLHTIYSFLLFFLQNPQFSHRSVHCNFLCIVQTSTKAINSAPAPITQVCTLVLAELKIQKKYSRNQKEFKDRIFPTFNATKKIP